MPATAPVSVLIPCYCCADTIERAVASVAQQTRPPAEIILIDDASPDGGETLSVLERLTTTYAERTPVRVIQMSVNGGPGTARNRGWDAVSQPYVAFLDADDAWHPKKLELQIAWMEAHPEVALTGTRTAVVESMDQLPSLPSEIQARPLHRIDLLLTNPLPTRSVVLRAELPQRFVPEKRYSEDYLLWATVLMSGYQATLLAAPLAVSFKRDFGAAGLSSHLWRMQWDVLDTYRRLRAAGYIGASLCVALEALSWVKFLRRVVMTAWIRS